MKIISIELQKLPNEGYGTFMVAVRDHILTYGAATLCIADLFTIFLTLLVKLDVLVEVIRKSDYTRKLEDDDKERDNIFRGLIGVVLSYRRHANVDKRDAGHRVTNLLKQYRKSILRAAYNVESGATANLIKDLRGQYAADVALLGIESWVDDLEAANLKFIADYSLRMKESTDKPKREIKVLRPRIDKIFHHIINILAAKLTVDGLDGDVVVEPSELDTGAHEDGDTTPPHLRGNVNYNCVVGLNEIIKKYNNMIAQHEGRLSAGHNDDDNEGEEAEEDND
jgi:hypothetical protein